MEAVLWPGKKGMHGIGCGPADNKTDLVRRVTTLNLSPSVGSEVAELSRAKCETYPFVIIHQIL
jgi:hypothetical protein